MIQQVNAASAHVKAMDSVGGLERLSPVGPSSADFLSAYILSDPFISNFSCWWH